MVMMKFIIKLILNKRASILFYFLNFGDYQDACLKTLDDPFLYHSAITPMLNIGLITDNEIIDYFNKFYKKNPNIGFNSYEGFIRQLIGWRNYIYASYILLHKLENNNNLQNNNKINKELIWKGETGILFIDNIMKKIWKFAYIHHIERLMYLGCFLLLLQIKPLITCLYVSLFSTSTNEILDETNL